MIQRSVLCIAVLFVAASSVPAQSDLAPGNYFLYYSPIAAREQGLFLIKVEKSNGKSTVSLLHPENASIEKSVLESRKVSITFKAFGGTYSFDGTISEKDPKLIRGTFGDDRLITRSMLVPTEKESLERADQSRNVKLPAAWTSAQALNTKLLLLRSKLRQADAETKKELNEQIAQAQKDVAEKSPALWKEILEKHPDSPAVVDAGLALLAKAEKLATPEEVGKWLKTIDAFTAPYGKRYSLEITSRALMALSKQKGFDTVALTAAEKALKAVSATTTAGQQSTVLKAVLAVQKKARKTDLAKVTASRLASVEETLDKEYLAHVPPFKPKAFEGRKSQSNRVAVMELFTGAQCPPCVAADVAFDALQKAYKPKDLILIQYHMHIPGPDPLTNEDSEARWKYYGNLRGTPSTLFNGKAQAGGGGGMANAESKFDAYKNIIDDLLEKETTIKLGGNVAVEGSKLAIRIQASGIPETSEKLKLRLLLVEESIKYTGGNGLRFHHQVVRAFPGGVEGMPLKEKSATKTAEVDLGEVRTNLTRYLDGYAKTREFPNPDRPMALKHLRVIALVQDDGSKEILQAVQLEVPQEK